MMPSCPGNPRLFTEGMQIEKKILGKQKGVGVAMETELALEKQRSRKESGEIGWRARRRIFGRLFRKSCLYLLPF
jgi:hypothetical protein